MDIDIAYIHTGNNTKFVYSPPAASSSSSSSAASADEAETDASGMSGPLLPLIKTKDAIISSQEMNYKLR